MGHITPGEHGPLVLVTYVCTEHGCGTAKQKFQPQPRELHNTDFRQYCWKCQKITPHTRHF